jgi:hypothetical protein
LHPVKAALVVARALAISMSDAGAMQLAAKDIGSWVR